jgi:hypothetical protein
MAVAGFKERICGKEIHHIPRCASHPAIITAQNLAQIFQILNTKSS